MTSKEIRHKISSILMEQQKIALKGFDVTSRSAWDRMTTEVAALESDLQRLEQMEAREADLRSFTPSPRPGSVSGDEQRHRYREAFRSFARTGQIAAEHRDLLTTSDSTGGALIPQIFSGLLIDALKFYGPIASKVAQKVTDNNGAPLKVSYDNDTQNGLTLLGVEGSTSPAETDPLFFSKIVGVDTASAGLIKVSFQEMEDSSFDLDKFIREKMGIRYARGLERAITLGVDSAGTALPNMPTGGLLNQAPVGTTTTALANNIGWDDLTALYTALDPAFAIPGRASWVFNSTTRGYLLGLKDGFGRPYFTPDPVADNPFGKLIGYDVILNQSMPSMGASATPILFGDLERGFLLRTDGTPSIVRLNERFADALEIGFFLWTRLGGLYLGQPVNGSVPAVSPVMKLQQAAS